MPSGSASARLWVPAPGDGVSGAAIGPVASAEAGAAAGAGLATGGGGVFGGASFFRTTDGGPAFSAGNAIESRARSFSSISPSPRSARSRRESRSSSRLWGSCHQDPYSHPNCGAESARMRDVRLPDFPCVVPVEVRFRDLDAMGHVNSAVYLTYFEQARLALLARAPPGRRPGRRRRPGPDRVRRRPGRVRLRLARPPRGASPRRLPRRRLRLLLLRVRLPDRRGRRLRRRRGPPRGLGPDRAGDVGPGLGPEGPAPGGAAEEDRRVPGPATQELSAAGAPRHWILTRPANPSSYPW